MATTASACKTVLAGTIAKSLLAEVAHELKQLSKPPQLVGYLSNQDPAARKYAEWTQRTCEENNVRYDLREVDKDDLEGRLIETNTDDDVNGVIVYFPIFNNQQDHYLQQIPNLTKDVEGLSHAYIFKLYHNIRHLDDAQTQKCILPCTPLAIVKILDSIGVYNSILPFGNRLHGRTITVVNRSETVGRPLAAMLANDGACVYSVDVTGVQKFTRGVGLVRKMHGCEDKPDWTLARCLEHSDVVISGVPGEKFKIPLEHLKDGCICVNFSTEKNFSPAVKEKCSIYVPSIGKVTIAILLRNLVRLAKNKEAGAGTS